MEQELRLKAEHILYKAAGRSRSAGAGIPILNGIDFSACAGEFVGIVGPNGSGKTTLLRSLAGFLPVEGTVSAAAPGGELRPVKEYSPRELARLAAYMHQDTVVPFAFTVREVVAMGRAPWLGRFSSPGEKDRRAAEAAMEWAGCLDLAERCVLELSGGERQRVMLARALAQDTPILLLDEPTASLDIRHALDVFSLCQSLVAAGRCVVAVFHDLRQAAAACSRLYLLRKGTVLAQGQADAVLNVDTLRQAYGVRAQVFRNPAGEWDYYIAGEENRAGGETDAGI